MTNLIKNLMDYASTHFRTEEDYFRKFAYPEAGSHMKEHSDFSSKVKAFKEDYDRGNVRLSIQVMNFLCDWVQNHIKGSDRRYGPFLKSKGIS
ncbi:MAG: bacteriohemerythrin [Desulfobacterota bacterium]|nr:bacteriohemerythrin [Thermodesulfobacteriota bacterium]